MSVRGDAVAFVLKGYPRLSETFIAQEIHALEHRGLAIRIVSLRHPTDRTRHPVHDEIHAPVLYLPEYVHDEPARVWRAWRAVRRMPGYPAALATWRRDFARDRTRNRARRFAQAMVLAHELPPDIGRLHAHFMHTPASVTRYASLMTGLPWTCSAHARDIWTSPEWEKREKLASCDWLVTCTAVNVAHLRALAEEPARVSLLYHGLDLDRLPAARDGYAARDGSDRADPVRFLSVGRAVEKKGYDDLLAAFAALPRDLEWRLVHVGGGALGDDLKRLAERLGIAARIEWRGARAQAEVLAAYAWADCFALACREAGDGDRDGLPNVLMEAQSQGLACLSTRFSAVPELIDDGETGLLVESRDIAALAAALERLARDPALRERLGRAGCARVCGQFSLDTGIGELARRFGLGGPAA
ncbi:MAG: glycosyltransferase family 4 protein [Planctomycetes bacterium]|nr:glycosyltransferase family 4 protein [Planctomycetota bacterium]